MEEINTLGRIWMAKSVISATPQRKQLQKIK